MFCSPPEYFYKKSLLHFSLRSKSEELQHFKVDQKFWKHILKSSKSSGQSCVPQRNSSAKNPYNIFLSSQNPKSYSTSNLTKNFENQILKSSRFLVRVLFPSGIILQKIPITFFSQVKIQKAIALQSWPKIFKTKFWKVPRVLFPSGIILQKIPITFFAAIKIQWAIALQSWPKILKTKFWKVPRVLVRVLFPSGIILQKIPITFFSQVKIQKAIALQSWPKILKTKFWKVPRVLVRVLFPPGIILKKSLLHFSLRSKSKEL